MPEKETITGKKIELSSKTLKPFGETLLSILKYAACLNHPKILVSQIISSIETANHKYH